MCSPWPCSAFNGLSPSRSSPSLRLDHTSSDISRPIIFLSLSTLSSSSLLFLLLPLRYSRIIFLVLFAVFRLAYNVGLGYVLRKQSTKRYIVRLVLRKGWLDAKKRPAVARWCKKELEGKIGEDYSFEKTPVEFTVWLLFRQVVDVILLKYVQRIFYRGRADDGGTARRANQSYLDRSGLLAISSRTLSSPGPSSPSLRTNPSLCTSSDGLVAGLLSRSTSGSRSTLTVSSRTTPGKLLAWTQPAWWFPDTC
jgi:hypothetical protein